MKFKLIALDLDGTTIDRRLHLSDINREAVNRVISQGTIVAVITGKMFAAALPFAHKFQGAAYLFASNGANVYDIQAQKDLISYPIPPEYIHHILHSIEKHQALYRIYTRDAMFAAQESHLVDSIRRDYPDLPVSVGPIPLNETYYKIFVQDDDAKLAAIIEDLKALPLQIHPSDNHNIEITHVQANKGEALRYLKQHLQIATEEVLAIGNHDNDLPMFAESGYSVAVANAPAYVQEKANMVTKHCEEDGVAYALAQLGVLCMK
ncbi:Cof-type HAD-IIB family hydrolase [Paenibacillus sp. KQZ6P-2]|uniref:Cof-type HAD-IIB family hydrolase n=1 Tax=Paenibacillus mangrovi TaxID=2931978 RepID=A0A9X1WV81_9BACL|nr:Cof-type HAD-IIB family hydrolase [Paenibacillus mangrovi]MCJ8014188.1 Cof-type HAD-IIB family hydrolase [Paenibacillus mangrovi]